MRHLFLLELVGLALCFAVQDLALAKSASSVLAAFGTKTPIPQGIQR